MNYDAGIRHPWNNESRSRLVDEDVALPVESYLRNIVARAFNLTKNFIMLSFRI